MKPLLLETIPDYTIWGADTLSKVRGEERNIGTWWECSAHPYCSNPVKNLEGKTLQDVIDENMEDILGPGLTLHEALRCAYLDAKDSLSIQVHPYDEYAWKYANDNGKHESWYVLDAKPGAKLVAGTKTNDVEVIKKALEDGTLEEYLNYVEVKAGDYVIIPVGMLHALGKDIFAIEVGTNSNTTYRFYDYNRTDAKGNKRPLHLKESFDVVNFDLKPTYVPAKQETRRIGDTPFYIVDELYLTEDTEYETTDSYFILNNMGEDTTIIWNDEEFTLPKYDCMFVPYSAKKITIKEGAHLLKSMPKKG